MKEKKTYQDGNYKTLWGKLCRQAGAGCAGPSKYSSSSTSLFRNFFLVNLCTARAQHLLGYLAACLTYSNT